MGEKKKRRFPADRMKLHALLDKREAQLRDLTAEVEELRALTIQADHLAITNATDALNVTPEQFFAFLAAMNKGTMMPDILLQTSEEEKPADAIETDGTKEEEQAEDDNSERE